MLFPSDQEKDKDGSSVCFEYFVGNSSHDNYGRKLTNDIHIGKEGVKLSIFTEHMISYTHKHK